MKYDEIPETPDQLRAYLPTMFGRSSQSASFPQRRWPHLVGYLTVLLTLGAYLHRLDRQALWWDEGFGVRVAQLPLAVSFPILAADVHPPAFYWLLRVWTQFAGPSPFSMRFFSVLIGVLLVAGLYACARRVHGPRAGAWAALLGAFSPFLMHHARDLRMYMLGLYLATIATYAFVPWLTTPRVLRRDWLMYAISLGLGLLTHYAFALIPLAHALAIGMAWRQNRATRWSDWLGSTALGVSLGAWWGLYASGQLRQLQAERVSDVRDIRTVWDGLVITVPRLLLGYSPWREWEWLSFGGLMILTALGLFALVQSKPALAVGVAALIGSSVVLAAIITYVPEDGVLLRAPRIAFAGVPLILVCAALGLDRLWQRRRWLFVLSSLLVLPGLGRGMAWQYTQPIDAREDYRPLVANLKALARPGDAVLTAYLWQDGYLNSYAPDVRWSFYRNNYNAQSAPIRLEQIFSSHDRVWVVNYLADINNLDDPLSAWLNRNAIQTLDVWYGNSQLSLFIKPAINGNYQNLETNTIAFGNYLVLRYLPVKLLVQPGDVVSVDLFWQAATPLGASYKTFIHLGLTHTPPIAQSDRIPGNGSAPTNTWLPNLEILDRHALIVPPDTMPGTYRLYAGIYDPQTSTRLSIVPSVDCDEMDRACIGLVEVTTTKP